MFDIDLLRRVGEVRAERSFRRTDTGHNVIAWIYPLAGLVYCAHCDKLAEKNNNPTLRSRLIGKAKNDDHKDSYRHRPGLECGCERKQVYNVEIEDDFRRPCQLLTLDEDAFGTMRTLAADLLNFDQKTEAEMDQKKAVAIAKCRRKLDATRNLYEDGDLEREEYIRRKQNIARGLLSGKTIQPKLKPSASSS